MAPIGSSCVGRNDKSSSGRGKLFQEEMEKRIRDTVGLQDKVCYKSCLWFLMRCLFKILNSVLTFLRT